MEIIPLVIKCDKLDLWASEEQKNKYFEYVKKIAPVRFSSYPVDALISIYSLPSICDNAIRVNMLGDPLLEVGQIKLPDLILVNEEPLKGEFFPVTVLEGPCDSRISSSISSLLWEFVFSVKFKIKPIEIAIPARFVFDSIEMIYEKRVAEPNSGFFKLLLRQISCPDGWFTCTQCHELFQEGERSPANDVVCPHCGHNMNPLFSERYYLKTLKQYLKFNTLK